MLHTYVRGVWYGGKALSYFWSVRQVSDDGLSAWHQNLAPSQVVRLSAGRVVERVSGTGERPHPQEKVRMIEADTSRTCPLR